MAKDDEHANKESTAKEVPGVDPPEGPEPASDSPNLENEEKVEPAALEEEWAEGLLFFAGEENRPKEPARKEMKRSPGRRRSSEGDRERDGARGEEAIDRAPPARSGPATRGRPELVPPLGGSSPRRPPNPFSLAIVAVLAVIAVYVIYRLWAGPAARPETVAKRFIEAAFETRREEALGRCHLAIRYFRNSEDPGWHDSLEKALARLSALELREIAVGKVAREATIATVALLVVYSSDERDECELTLSHVEGRWGVVVPERTFLFSWEADIHESLEPLGEAESYFQRSARK